MQLATSSLVDISRSADFERELFNATAEVPACGVVTIIVGDRPAQPFNQDVTHLLRLRRVEIRASRPEIAEQWMQMLKRAAWTPRGGQCG